MTLIPDGRNQLKHDGRTRYHDTYHSTDGWTKPFKKIIKQIDKWNKAKGTRRSARKINQREIHNRKIAGPPRRTNKD